MITKFQVIVDGHLGQMQIAKHCIKLAPEHIQSTLFAPQKLVSKAQRFQNAELNRMMAQSAIEPAQTKWTAPIVFASKMWPTTFLCRLKKIKLCRKATFIPNTPDARVH